MMDNEILAEKFNKLLILPSGSAVIVIVILLALPRFRSLFLRNKLIISLLATILILNLIEVVTYSNLSGQYELLLRLYYSTSIIGVSIFFCLSERLNDQPILSRHLVYYALLILSGLLVLGVLAGDLLISGAERSSYSISRIPGQFYWLIQAYVLSCMILGALLIVRSTKITNNPLERKRNKVILLSFIPIILAVAFVMLLIQFESGINLSIIFPLSTLIFILVYLFTDNKNDLFRILVNIPFSKERKAYKELNMRVLNFISKTQTDEAVSLKELLTEIEKTFISNTLEIKDGNHNLAAELLSISISTIYRNKEKDEKKND